MSFRYAARCKIVIAVGTATRQGWYAYGNQHPISLTLPQVEFLAKLTGTHYPERHFPIEGWSGDTNAWDAAEYCRKLINVLATIPSDPASEERSFSNSL